MVQWLRDGLGIIRIVVGSGSPGQFRSRQWRSLLRPRLRGPWRPALGFLRARRNLRSHPRQHGGPHRARRLGEHRLSGRRLDGCRSDRHRHSAQRVARGWRRIRQRQLSCNFRRTFSACPWCARDDGNDRARRRISGWPGRATGRTCGQFLICPARNGALNRACCALKWAPCDSGGMKRSPVPSRGSKSWENETACSAASGDCRPVSLQMKGLTRARDTSSSVWASCFGTCCPLGNNWAERQPTSPTSRPCSAMKEFQPAASARTL